MMWEAVSSVRNHQCYITLTLEKLDLLQIAAIRGIACSMGFYHHWLNICSRDRPNCRARDAISEIIFFFFFFFLKSTCTRLALCLLSARAALNSSSSSFLPSSCCRNPRAQTHTKKKNSWHSLGVPTFYLFGVRLGCFFVQASHFDSNDRALACWPSNSLIIYSCSPVMISTEQELR